MIIIENKDMSGRRSSSKKIKVSKFKREEDFSSLNVLRYESFETLKVCPTDRKYFIETDKNFISDVSKIAKVRRVAALDMLKQNNDEITDQICNEIDYKARLHSKANTVNSNSNYPFQAIEESKRCQCGCMKGAGDVIPICVNEQKLNILGPGTILLFLYNKAIFFVLAMVIVVYAIYAIATNLLGNQANLFDDCAQNSYCQFKHEVSDENKNFEERPLFEAQQWLGLVFCLVWIVTLRIIKYFGREKNKMVDESLNSASDYAIKIEGLPPGTYSEFEMIEYFERAHEKIHTQNNQMQRKNEQTELDNPFKIKSIQIIYNMQFARTMIGQIFFTCLCLDALLVQPDGQAQRNFVKEVQRYNELKNKLKQTYELLIDLRKKFLNDPKFRQNLSTTCTLVEFKTQYKRELIVQRYGNEEISLVRRIFEKIKSCFGSESKGIIFKGNVIKLERAPEPSDVLWENCEKKQSFKKKLVIYGLTFLIVLVSLGLQIGLEFGQRKIKENPDFFEGTLSSETQITIVINAVMSIGLLITNKVLWFVLFYLLAIEYNHTNTEMIISQMDKVLFAASINTIAVPLITLFVFDAISDPTLHGDLKQNIYSTAGLSGLAFDYQISVMGGLFIKLFDPLFLIKKVVIEVKPIRNRMIRYICGKTTHINLEKGVSEVNKIYEGEEFDIAENYVYIIGAIYHAAFYCHLQPFLIILVTCSIVLFFLINRFKLVRICKIPYMTSIKVFEVAITHSGKMVLLYGMGSIIISFLQQQADPERPNYSYVPSGIAIGIGLFDYFNPCNVINRVLEKIMLRCNCISVEKVLGEEAEESKLSMFNEGKEKRLQLYYENSNALTLLGFEKILRGQSPSDLMGELRQFCESFFPKQTQLGLQTGVYLTGGALKYQQELDEQMSHSSQNDRPQQIHANISRLPPLHESPAQKYRYQTNNGGPSHSGKLSDE